MSLMSIYKIFLHLSLSPLFLAPYTDPSPLFFYQTIFNSPTNYMYST